MTDYSNEVIKTKKGYSFSTEESENQNISLANFLPEKKKQLTVNLKNFGDSNTYTSSNLSEIINVYNGAYNMTLYGTNANKTVKLGNTSGNSINISNIGKNKITSGDNGNTFQTSNPYSNNTITAGTGVDTYYLKEGNTKITDKGGVNYYSIDGGLNNIVEKGNDGSKFNIYYTASSQGATTIKAGNGMDNLKIYNDYNPKNELIVTADLGKGDDNVLVDYKTGSEDKKDASVVNIKTGIGSDIVNIKAGLKNVIDTGKDSDEVHIYGGKNNYISTGDGKDEITIHATNTYYPHSTIKAGNGDDTIYVYAGETIIYGEGGKDTIEINNNGSTTVYGGNDTITVESFGSGSTDIYASADTINLVNGFNSIYTKKGGNTINVKSYTAGNAAINTIYLQKGNNTVNFDGDNNTKKANAIIHITSGKNTINAKGYSFVDVNTNDKNDNTVNLKTAQTLNISGNSVVNSIELGKGNDIITNSSNADEGFSGCYSGHGTYAGKGNDKFYISNGKNKFFHGQEGNDYFEITSGNAHKIRGGYGDDTIIINGGDDLDIEANGGNDKITINGGSNNKISGASGNDIYNILKSNRTEISDDEGKNTYNIKKGYSGLITIKDSLNSSKVVFEDKSLKLSGENNVNNDNSITTDEKTLSIYCNYIFYQDKGFGDSKQISLVYDLQSDVSDGYVNGNKITLNHGDDMGSYTIGGKKYTLNIEQLKSDLTAWNTSHGGDNWDVESILSGNDAEAKSSLVAIFVKDTQSCFV
ncbi:hypothetical protein IJ182_01990 [bacterium]|nr:hypothetical protein [bacterium]